MILHNEGTEGLHLVRMDRPNWARTHPQAGFLIAHPIDHPPLDEKVWRLMYQDPVSGANLYRRL